jgi:hypothetical protein
MRLVISGFTLLAFGIILAVVSSTSDAQTSVYRGHPPRREVIATQVMGHLLTQYGPHDAAKKAIEAADELISQLDTKPYYAESDAKRNVRAEELQKGDKWYTTEEQSGIIGESKKRYRERNQLGNFPSLPIKSGIED